MPIKTFKPYTQSRRQMSVSDFSDITKTTPEKSLISIIKKSGGRNNTGQVMVRFRGGGHKRFYRSIDFKREKIFFRHSAGGSVYNQIGFFDNFRNLG